MIGIALGFVFLVKDTPMCLVTRYSPEDAKKAFDWIAKLNGRSFNVSAKQIK